MSLRCSVRPGAVGGLAGYIQHAPHLYITAAIALVFKAIVIPMALQRMVVRLGIHREIETVVGIGLTMLPASGWWRCRWW